MKTSVALCTFNGERFLKQQLDSILNQTKKVDEIVVCDDGSNDATISILIDYDKKFPGIFKIHQNEKNLRSVKNFEKAMLLCTHAIIFLSDQDDVWLPEKVEKYLDFFEQNPEIDVLASNGFGIDEENQILSVYTLWDVPSFFKEKNIPVNYFEMISFCGNIVTGATVALRKNFLPEILPFPLVDDFHHDEWIGLRASLEGKLHLFEEKYFKYRAHDNQQVGGIFFKKTEKEKRMLIRMFDFTLHDQKFISYKRILKKLVTSVEKNKKLASAKGYEATSKKVNEDLISRFHELKAEMQKLYPVQSFFLSVSDKILNKRKLK